MIWQPGQVSVCCDTPLPPQSAVDFSTKDPLSRLVVVMESGAAQAPGLPSMVRRRAREPSKEVELGATQGRAASSPHTLGPMVARLFCTSVLSCTHVATM